MTNRLSYGGEAHPEPDVIARLTAHLQEYADTELGEHHTMELKTWDDQTITAKILETVEMVPGAGTVEPAAIRHEVKYKEKEDTIVYREVLDKHGKIVEKNNVRTLEENVLEQ